MGTHNRALDRLLGIMITIGVGLAVNRARSWFRQILEQSKKLERKEKARTKSKTTKEGTEGDENYRSRNTQAPHFVHNGSCHCQRIRFRLKAPRVIFAVDIPSKVRYPRVSLPVENFEPLSDEHLMSMYAVKSVDSGLGIHTFCSYCGVHVLFAPSTEPQEVQINVDCLDRSQIEKVYVSYMATQDSVPVPTSYVGAQQFNKRGTGAMYNKVGSSGGGQRGGKQERDAYAYSGMMVALDDPSGAGGTRYSSPADSTSKPGGAKGNYNRYNLPYSTPGSTSSNVSKRESTTMEGLFSGMSKWLSPFSKLQAAAVKQKEVDEACESYFETYYSAAGAHGDDLALDAYSSGHGAYSTDAPSSEQMATAIATTASPHNNQLGGLIGGRGKFSLTSGINADSLEKQLKVMSQNLGPHLEENEGNLRGLPREELTSM